MRLTVRVEVIGYEVVVAVVDNAVHQGREVVGVAKLARFDELLL